MPNSKISALIGQSNDWTLKSDIELNNVVQELVERVTKTADGLEASTENLGKTLSEMEIRLKHIHNRINCTKMERLVEERIDEPGDLGFALMKREAPAKAKESSREEYEQRTIEAISSAVHKGFQLLKTLDAGDFASQNANDPADPDSAGPSEHSQPPGAAEKNPFFCHLPPIIGTPEFFASVKRRQMEAKASEENKKLNSSSSKAERVSPAIVSTTTTLPKKEEDIESTSSGKSAPPQDPVVSEAHPPPRSRTFADEIAEIAASKQANSQPIQQIQSIKSIPTGQNIPTPADHGHSTIIARIESTSTAISPGIVNTTDNLPKPTPRQQEQINQFVSGSAKLGATSSAIKNSPLFQQNAAKLAMSTERQNEASRPEKQPPKLTAVNAPSGNKVGGGGQAQAQTAQKSTTTTSTPIRSVGKRASRGNARKSLFSSSSEEEEDGEERSFFARHPPPPSAKSKEKQQQKPVEKERKIETARVPNLERQKQPQKREQPRQQQQLGESTAAVPAKQENREQPSIQGQSQPQQQKEEEEEAELEEEEAEDQQQPEDMSKPVFKTFDTAFSDRLAAAIQHGPVALRPDRAAPVAGGRRPLSAISIPSSGGGDEGGGGVPPARPLRKTESSVSSNEELGPATVKARIAQIGSMLPFNRGRGGGGEAADANNNDDEMGGRAVEVQEAKAAPIPPGQSDALKSRAKGPARRAPTQMVANRAQQHEQPPPQPQTPQRAQEQLPPRPTPPTPVQMPPPSSSSNERVERQTTAAAVGGVGNVQLPPASGGGSRTATKMPPAPPPKQKGHHSSIFSSSSSDEELLLRGKPVPVPKTVLPPRKEPVPLPTQQQQQQQQQRVEQSNKNDPPKQKRKGLFDDSDSDF